MKKIILALACFICLTSCYQEDYQNSIRKEFPASKIFQLDLNSNSDYLVVTQDSSVYVVECSRLFSTKPSNKKFLFNLKTVMN